MSNENRARATKVRRITWLAMSSNRTGSWMELHKDKGMDTKWTCDDCRGSCSKKGYRDKESIVTETGRQSEKRGP